MNPQQKQTVQKLRGAYSTVITHKDGTITIRRGYYYRPGSLEDFAKKVFTNFPELKLVSKRDKWQPYPRDSYYEAIVKF